MKNWILIAVGAVVLLTFGSTVTTVSETEAVVITRFGEPVRTVDTPGLHWRMPWGIERLQRIDTRLMVFDTPARDEMPREVLTLDKKNVEIASYTCWRVEDPLRFLQTVSERKGAEAFLSDVVVSELGKVLGRTPLSALVNVDADSLAIQEINEGIRATSDAIARAECGVTVVDFAIKRVNFPEQNRGSVFDRMRAERKQIATRIRSEGEEQARKLRAQADRESAQILAEAERQALSIEGEAEAQAARLYTEAYGKNRELYEFLRTLESYEQTLTKGATILLPRDMDYLRILVDPPDSGRREDQEGSRR